MLIVVWLQAQLQQDHSEGPHEAELLKSVKTHVCDHYFDAPIKKPEGWFSKGKVEISEVVGLPDNPMLCAL